MCRWITYAGPPIYLDGLIFETAHSLIDQSRHARQSVSAINADGFGIGWYGEREQPGIFKDIQPAWNDQNLRSLTHQISSRLFFAHVRASTGTPASRVNCHPFRWNNWLFMHNGRIGNFERVRHRLVTGLTPETFGLIKGATDSELMFMLMIDHGLATDPEGAINRMISDVCRAMDEAVCEDPFSMSIALSDGETTYAARFASAGEPPSLYYNLGDDVGTRTGQPGPGGDESVMIVSEPLDDDMAHWTAVAPSHLVIAGPGGIASVAIDPA